MMRALWIPTGLLVVTSAVIAGAATGCATATGEITGGEARFDASEPLSTLEIDGGPLSTGHSWAELYGDYFGNPRASCAGNGSCHGDANQPGSQDSNYVCPPNDKDACYTSMTSIAAALVTTSDPASSPLTASVLRHADGSAGNMPKSPAYGFTATDLARIQAWIAAGAPNDEPVDGGSENLDAGNASD
jgi:hypothetical protein